VEGAEAYEEASETLAIRPYAVVVESTYVQNSLQIASLTLGRAAHAHLGDQSLGRQSTHSAVTRQAASNLKMIVAAVGA
jgi:hypothetical protein